jgi:hypothetical protein
MDSVITSKLGNSWPKYAAYLLVAGVILTFISLSIKKLVDSDDEEQKKFGKQLGISVGVLGIIGLLIVGYTSMSDDKRSVINFLLEFFPYILLLGGIAGLFYLVFPDNNITEDLKDVQKRMGIVAGVGTVAVAITALLTSSMLRTDPGPTFFPFTMTMIFVNLQISLLSFLSVFYGKV